MGFRFTRTVIKVVKLGLIYLVKFTYIVVTSYDDTTPLVVCHLCYDSGRCHARDLDTTY